MQRLGRGRRHRTPNIGSLDPCPASRCRLSSYAGGDTRQSTTSGSVDSRAPDKLPTILVPQTCWELLVRDTHDRMFHLNQAKVCALMRGGYFWPTMQRDVRKILADCPTCELTKARQNTPHGLFSAMPIHAPRSRWCMDFQGQGTALTGETEALALIDPTSRYVVVQKPGCSLSWIKSCSLLELRARSTLMLPPSFSPRP